MSIQWLFDVIEERKENPKEGSYTSSLFQEGLPKIAQKVGEEGTEVVVTPVSDVRGSSEAIIAAMEAAPEVPSEWVDELEQLIAEGQRTPAPPVSFDHETDSNESP